MSDEAQVFRGDRPAEEAENGAAAPPQPKAAPKTIVAKNDLPAGEPVGDAAATDAAPQEPEALSSEPAGIPAPVAAEPEPEYHFEVDPESLWSMPEAMKERLTNLTATVTVIHQQLDDQEKETARIAKALRSLK